MAKSKNNFTRKQKPPVQFVGEHDKVPPQAVDIEEIVLGSIMLEADALTAIVNVLKPEIFYKESHQIICKAILQLHKRDDPVDILTVTNELINNKELELIGGGQVITNLTDRIGSTANIEYHMKILSQKHIQRELIRVGSEIVKDAYEDGKDVFDLLDSIEDNLALIWQPINMLKKKRTKDVGKSLEKAFSEETDETIFTKVYNTGYPIFDDKVETTHNKILLLAGAAADGKSRFVSSYMFRLLGKHTKNIAIKWVTLEDSAEDVSTFYFSSLSMLTIKDIKRKRINNNQREYLNNILKVYNTFDIEFTEESQKIREITKSFEVFCQQRPDKLNILIIDNLLSLMDRDDFGRDLNPMYDYVMAQILICKQRTKGLIIPIHHYRDAQMNKGNLHEGYRPRIDDLKGTEALRRVPNQVLLFNNPSKRKDLFKEYYGERKKILKNMFIVDPGKIRDDDNDDMSALMYFYADLGYCTFYEIPRV